MKTLLLILSFAAGLTLVVLAAESSAGPRGKLRHVVAFKVKDGTSTEKIKEVEDAFRDGFLKVLVSTTTLAMGVNLPADSVVIADHERWDPRNRINRNIDIAEYKNCAGRAGRLGQSQRGQSYLLVDEQGFAGGVANHFFISGFMSL